MKKLNAAEGFAVSSLRLWALPYCYPERTFPDWRGRFARIGIDAMGALSFDRLCQLVAADAFRPLEVCSLRWPELSADEAWLLQTTALLQHNLLTDATLHLLDRCGPKLAPLALMPARAFALALQGRWKWISLRAGNPHAQALTRVVCLPATTGNINRTH